MSSHGDELVDKVEEEEKFSLDIPDYDGRKFGAKNKKQSSTVLYGNQNPVMDDLKVQRKQESQKNVIKTML